MKPEFAALERSDQLTFSELSDANGGQQTTQHPQIKQRPEEDYQDPHHGRLPPTREEVALSRLLRPPQEWH